VRAIGRSRHRYRWRARRPLAAGARSLVAVAALAPALVVLLPAGPAQAHPPGIQAAQDYQTRVTAIVPELPGVRARYVADGARLELRNDSSRVIEVLGYQREPMLQIRPDGVWQNTRAPSLYVDNLGTATDPAANDDAPPQWQRTSDRPIARWQDHRALWHGNPPPAVRADPTRSQRVSDWQVPLRDGAATAEITGTVDWVPPPEPGTWWAITLLAAATVAALGLLAPPARRRAASWARAGLATSAVVVGLLTAGYPLLVAIVNAEPGAGTVAAAGGSRLVPLLVGLGLILAGGLILARSAVGGLALAIAGVCATLSVGVTNVALFSHGVAPVPSGGEWARMAVAAVLGGASGLAIAGVVRIRRATPVDQPKQR
jgi:hypothetical protein